MRLLLDTHVAIWVLVDSPRLSAHARTILDASGNKVFVSAVSIWEIAIKRTTARRGRPPFSGIEAKHSLERAGCTILDVTAEHAAAVERLPLLHKDPFDRLLVAQALSEPLILLTHDAEVVRYSETIMKI